MAHPQGGRRVLHGRDGPHEAREGETRAAFRAERFRESWRIRGVSSSSASSVADAPCMRRVAAIIENEPAGRSGRRVVGEPGSHRRAPGPGGGRGAAGRHPAGADGAADAARGHGRDPVPGSRGTGLYERGLDADSARTSPPCCRRCGWRGSASPGPRATSSSGSGSCGLPASLPAPWWRAAGGPASAGVDARDIVEVEWGHLGPAVRWEPSRANAQRIVGTETAPEALIMTGFIARDADGVATTLGRNGSDYSRVDLRRAARRRGDPHLDRRRRRAERRPAARARGDACSTRCRTTRRWSWRTSAPR